MSRLKLLLIIAGIPAVLLGGTFVMTGPATSVGTEPPSLAALEGSGPLDGLAFSSVLGLEGKPGDIEDHLIFAAGMFLSSECESECNYPPSPYFVRERDGAIEFVSESKCPHKNATIVWRGVVEDGRIEGESTWTLKRWYWTVEKTFWFEGELSDRAVSSSDG